MESHQENPNLSDIPSTHRQLAQLGHVHTRPINRPLQGEALHSGRQNDRQDTYQDDSQDDRPSYQPRHTQVGLHDSATLQADPHQQVRKKKKEKKRGTRPPLPSSTSLNASQYERDTQQQVPDIDAMPLEDEHGRIDDDIERHFRGFRARLEAHAQEVPNTEWMYHVSSWFELDAVDALVHEQRRLRTMMSSVAASESLWASKHQEVHREHQELDRKHAEMDRQHEELHSQLRRLEQVFGAIERFWWSCGLTRSSSWTRLTMPSQCLLSIRPSADQGSNLFVHIFERAVSGVCNLHSARTHRFGIRVHNQKRNGIQSYYSASPDYLALGHVRSDSSRQVNVDTQRHILVDSGLK
ncbi:hypothetical protein M8818_006444 [Zalaria obscura]|uniref:Uncharacterized protein n=1 Tax=Zalaria obscura TaxID=2024903 RepID=A0ACC3S6G4_9PEZI